MLTWSMLKFSHKYCDFFEPFNLFNIGTVLARRMVMKWPKNILSYS